MIRPIHRRRWIHLAYTFNNIISQRGNWLHERTHIGPPRTATDVRYIFGDNVAINPIPEETTRQENRPVVTFRNPLNGQSFGLNNKLLSTHMLLIGDTGKGKTNCNYQIIDGTIRNLGPEDVLIIFDQKGDYFRTFAPFLPSSFVTVISCSPGYRGITKIWNIFGELMDKNEKGDYLVDAVFTFLFGEETGHSLVKNVESSYQPFFHVAAMLLIADTIIYMIRTAQATGTPVLLNNKELVKKLIGSTIADFLQMYDSPLMFDRRGDKDFIYKKDSNMAQGVMAFVRASVNQMLIGPFGDAAADSSREFSIRSIVQAHRQHIVFIINDPILGETLAPVYGLMMDSAVRTQISVNAPENALKNVYLNIDEASLAPGHMMDTAINVGRSKGLKVLMGLQNIQQLRDIHGKEKGDAIYGGFGNLFAFHMNDPETRDYVRKRLGSNRYMTGMRVNNVMSYKEADGWTAEDWQLQGLGIGDAVCDLNGYRPFLFHFPEFTVRKNK